MQLDVFRYDSYRDLKRVTSVDTVLGRFKWLRLGLIGWPS